VDSRSVGRLAAILDAISDYQDDFADNAANISNRAIDSIARDARTRLDDIAPTIDRIRASYFRFIEGIYKEKSLYIRSIESGSYSVEFPRTTEDEKLTYE
jgi:hypothetical protein